MKSRREQKLSISLSQNFCIMITLLEYDSCRFEHLVKELMFY